MWGLKRAAFQRPFLFLMVVLSFQGSWAFDESKLKEVSESFYWLTLLHYRQPILGKFKSEVDSPNFFLSPEGKYNPLAELKATISALDPKSEIRVGAVQQTVQCAFPERWRFLKEQLGLTYPQSNCPDFARWKEALKAESVTVIYAAPYMGNPASMFGHTFLRLDSAARYQNTPKTDLLDFAVSFEAFTGDDNSISYAFKGLLGFYPGHFFQYPYYLKLLSYTDQEARDLWEYQLNLTSEQMDRLLNHLWEMGDKYIDYYFFDENCSYHILSLIEVAQGDTSLRTKFTFMTVPSDTVRILNDIPGLIRSRKHRPSVLGILESRLDAMGSDDRKEFYQLKEDPSGASEKTRGIVLDALLDWQKFSALQSGKTFKEASEKLDSKLLNLRAKNPDKYFEPATPQTGGTAPESGHKSTKLTARTGYQTDSPYVGLELRPVFHDFLDPDEGYLPFSFLSIGKTIVDLRFRQPSLMRLEELSIADVASLGPYSSIRKNFAWTVGGGLIRPKDTGCVACLVGQFRFGGGLSLSTFGTENHRGVFYLLGRFQGEAGAIHRYGYRVSPGGEAGIISALGSDFKIQLFGRYLRHLNLSRDQEDETWTIGGIPSLVMGSYNLRLNAEYLRTPRRFENEFGLQLGMYF